MSRWAAERAGSRNTVSSTARPFVLGPDGLVGRGTERVSRLQVQRQGSHPAFADESAKTYEWLVAHGVTFVDKARTRWADMQPGTPLRGRTMPRRWRGPLVQAGGPVSPDVPRPRPRASASSGRSKLPQKIGCSDPLQHKMVSIIRENQNSGRVLGIAATNQGKTVNIRARKGVIIGTGGHSSNVNFRRFSIRG